MVFRAKIEKAFPLELALFLRDLTGAQTFIETGTYKGDTARLCAQHFKKVITVEGVPERFLELFHQQWPANVELVGGDSGEILPELFEDWDISAHIFWLDAHWIHNGCDLETDPLAEGISPCPLLKEIEAISMWDSVLIDDARYFLSPYKGRKGWPTLDEIVREFAHTHYVFLYQDVLCAIPNKYREQVQEWLYEHNLENPSVMVYWQDGKLFTIPNSLRDSLRVTLLNE